MPKNALHASIHSNAYSRQTQLTASRTSTTKRDSVRCICNDFDEYGLMIRCERCLTWQHGKCLNITAKCVPQHHVCRTCLSRFAPTTPPHISTHQRHERTSTTTHERRNSKGISTRPIDTPCQDNFNMNRNKVSLSASYLDNRNPPSPPRQPPLHLKPRKLSNPWKEEEGQQHQDEMQKNSSDDDDEDDDLSSRKSNQINKKLQRLHCSTTIRTTRTANNYEQIFRNVIKSKLVKPIMKAAAEYWYLNKNEENDALDVYKKMDGSLLLPTVSKVSVHPVWKPLVGSDSNPSVRKGIFAEVHVPEQRFLMEIVGEIAIKSAYRCDPTSLYPILHTRQDKVFFYPGLDLLMDTRDCGNDARFVRRSCYPNADIKCILLQSSQHPYRIHDRGEHSSNSTIHLGLFASEDVEKGEEISVAWDWQYNSIVWKKFACWQKRKARGEGYTNNSTDNDDNSDHDDRQQFERILDRLEKEFGGCACQVKEECFLEYLKKSRSPVKIDCMMKKERQAGTSRRNSNNMTDFLDDTDSQGQSERQRPKRRRRKSSVGSQESLQIVTQTAKGYKRPRMINRDFSDEELAVNDITSTAATTTSATTHCSNLILSVPSATPPLAKTIKDESSQTIEISSPMVKKRWVTTCTLPCKKAWMRTYLAELALLSSSSPTTTSKNLAEDFWKEDDADETTDNTDGITPTAKPLLPNLFEQHTTNDCIRVKADTVTVEASIITSKPGAALSESVTTDSKLFTSPSCSYSPVSTDVSDSLSPTLPAKEHTTHTPSVTPAIAISPQSPILTTPSKPTRPRKLSIQEYHAMRKAMNECHDQ